MTYTIAPCTPADLREIEPKLRPLDRIELESLGMKPMQSLWRGYRSAVFSKACRVDGEIAAVWGVSGSPLSPEGQLWLLTSPAIETVPLAFYKEGKRELFRMLEIFPRIGNNVLASYTQAVRLIEMTGFTLEEPKPHHKTGVLFRRFWMDRQPRSFEFVPMRRAATFRGLSFAPERTLG